MCTFQLFDIRLFLTNKSVYHLLPDRFVRRSYKVFFEEPRLSELNKCVFILADTDLNVAEDIKQNITL